MNLRPDASCNLPSFPALLLLATTCLMDVGARAATERDEIVRIGPELLLESLVGIDAQRLEDALGAPDYGGTARGGGRTLQYWWSRVFTSDGKLKFDGRGVRDESEVEESDFYVTCGLVFTIHSTGLVLDVESRGACNRVVPASGTWQAHELSSLESSKAAVRFDGPDAFARLGRQLTIRLAVDDPEGFDEYFERLSRGEPSLLTGRSPLGGVLDQIRLMLLSHNRWTKYHERIVSWRERMPQSTGIAILEAAYWTASGWHARGLGPISTTSEEGLALFRRRISKALSLLDACAPYAAENPVWHQLRLRLMLYSGVDKREIEAASVAATKRFPDYLDLRTGGMGPLQPKWGGSFAEMRAYIDRQVEEAEPSRRVTLHTQLVWAAQQMLGPTPSVFSVLDVDWQRVAAGFEALLAAAPASFWTRQNYAAFACRAGDKETYRRLRPEIEGFIHPLAWLAPYNLETCDHRMLTGA